MYFSWWRLFECCSGRLGTFQRWTSPYGWMMRGGVNSSSTSLRRACAFLQRRPARRVSRPSRYMIPLASCATSGCACSRMWWTTQRAKMCLASRAVRPSTPVKFVWCVYSDMKVALRYIRHSVFLNGKGYGRMLIDTCVNKILYHFNL